MMNTTHHNPAAAPAHDRSRYTTQGHVTHSTVTVWYTRPDGHQRYVGTCTPVPGQPGTWLAVGLSDDEPSRLWNNLEDGLRWLIRQHQATIVA